MPPSTSSSAMPPEPIRSSTPSNLHNQSDQILQVSPQFPSPINTSRQQNFIPESPQTLFPASSKQPLGSPTRRLPIQSLDHSLLDPTLRHLSFTSRSTDEISDLKSTTANDSDDERTLTKISSESSQPPKTKGKKLTIDTVEYEENSTRRDNYYRTTGQRMKDSMTILGIRTRCYGILLLLRYITLRSFINFIDR
jgi:hypothetical protein